MQSEPQIEPKREGLALKIEGADAYKPMFVKPTKRLFWEVESQAVVLDSPLKRFLPAVQTPENGQALFSLVHDNSGQEYSRLSRPLDGRHVPRREKSKLRDGVLALLKTGEKPSAVYNAKQTIKAFKLPDIKKEPYLYRLYGPFWHRRLVVLWGCERAAGNSLDPLEAIGKLDEEEDWWGPMRLGMLLLSICAVLGLGWLAMQRGARLLLRTTFAASPAAVFVSRDGWQIEARSRSGDAAATLPAVASIHVPEAGWLFLSGAGTGEIEVAKGETYHFTAFHKPGDYRATFRGSAGNTRPREATISLRDTRGAPPPGAVRASLLFEPPFLVPDAKFPVPVVLSYPAPGRGAPSAPTFAWNGQYFSDNLVERPGTVALLRHVLPDGKLGDLDAETLPVSGKGAWRQWWRRSAPVVTLLGPPQGRKVTISIAGSGTAGFERAGRCSVAWGDGNTTFVGPQEPDVLEHLYQPEAGERPCIAVSFPDDNGLPPLHAAEMLVDLSGGSGLAAPLAADLSGVGSFAPGGSPLVYRRLMAGAGPLALVRISGDIIHKGQRGATLRLVSVGDAPPSFFSRVRWKCNGDEMTQANDCAEVLLLGEAGDYRIQAEAQSPGGKVALEQTMHVDAARDLSFFDRLLHWFAR